MLSKYLLQELLSKIEFPEDLNFIHPDKMKEYVETFSGRDGIYIHTIGMSPEGRPIYAFEIGKGEKIIFVSGGAHSNEPSGTATLVHLAGELVKLQKDGYLKDYKFYFLPQLDPDSAVINWAWMKEPFSYKNLVRYSYCKVDPDIENGIPVEGDEKAARPEIAAFKGFIDSVEKVDYYVTLHTTPHLGGALFLLRTKELEEVKPVMEFITENCEKEGLPMYNIDVHGVCGYEYIAPGFVKTGSLEDNAKFYKDSPEMLKKLKLSTYQYAMEKRGAKLAFIAELPFIVDPELNDQEETKISLYDLTLEKLRRGEKNFEIRMEIWKDLQRFPITEENKLWIEFYEFMDGRTGAGLKAQKKDMDRYKDKFAKMHELSGLSRDNYSAQFSRALMALRRLSGVNREEAKELYKKYEEIYEEGWREYERRITCRVISLREQVKLQTAMIMAGLLIL